MVMSQHLELAARGQLALNLTPGMRQSIEVLQLPQVELNDWVNQQVDVNPLLSRVDCSASEFRNSSTSPPSDQRPSHSDRFRMTDFSIDTSSEFPADPFSGIAQPRSLIESLEHQLCMSVSISAERRIGRYLIQSLDEAGYLRTSLASVARRLEVDLHQLESVFKRMQAFEPVGVFARDLSECLSLQLIDQNRMDAPMRRLMDNLSLMASGRLQELADICAISENELGARLALLKRLNPKPAMGFDVEVVPTLQPDVRVFINSQGEWTVEINSDACPKVDFDSPYFRALSSQNLDRETRQYLTTCRTSAKWLVRVLERRYATVLRVSRAIVAHQRAYFDLGIAELKPMTLRLIAETLDYHESTISRAVTNKTMQTPRGNVQLRKLFQNEIRSGDQGKSIAPSAIQFRIRQYIEVETSTDVMSDEAIVSRLAQDDIHLARRTVAKYRTIMGIPTSQVRRRLKPGGTDAASGNDSEISDVRGSALGCMYG